MQAAAVSNAPRGERRADAASIDLAFRPADYFAPLTPGQWIAANIAGEQRRATLLRLVRDGRGHEIPPQMLESNLPWQMHVGLAMLNPQMLGGETLPAKARGEIEIARIALDSTLADVYAVFVRRVGSRLSYRVVDDCEGMGLQPPTRRTSVRPLSLGELERLLDAVDLCGILGQFNALDDMLSFFTASSAFYPQLDALLRQRVRHWHAGRRIAADTERDANEGACPLPGHAEGIP
jgi:hypothetical protein